VPTSTEKKQVFKFGGASVKNAEAIVNVYKILTNYPLTGLWVVISAMGKTTNALEEVVKSCFERDGKALEKLITIRRFHEKIIEELGLQNDVTLTNLFNNFFTSAEWEIEDSDISDYDKKYDQIVSLGEFISTLIVSAYFRKQGLDNVWIDARDLIKTDNRYREASINWEETAQSILVAQRSNSQLIKITQGFIGCDFENYTTTLGREGSDYTAAVVAYALEAEKMTVWKDVPGVLNADPKWFDNTVLLNHLSYLDTIELAYYGATILHPKTIKPLQNKNIPLYVKSFVNPNLPGTRIDNNTSGLTVPSFIFKVNQLLISISPKDFSFIVEENLSHIFLLFSKYGVKINTMQNSALSFSVCVDYDEKKSATLISALRENYKVLYNTGLELITIRNYDQSTINRVMDTKRLLLEVKSRNTVQLVVLP